MYSFPMTSDEDSVGVGECPASVLTLTFGTKGTVDLSALRGGRTSTLNKLIRLSELSGLRRDVDEICALLEYYAAYSGNSLPTFRVNLSSRLQRRIWKRCVISKYR